MILYSRLLQLLRIMSPPPSTIPVELNFSRSLLAVSSDLSQPSNSKHELPSDEDHNDIKRSRPIAASQFAQRQSSTIEQLPALVSATHNGTTLSQVTDYLEWFLRSCPQFDMQINSVLGIMRHHFEQPDTSVSVISVGSTASSSSVLNPPDSKRSRKVVFSSTPKDNEENIEPTTSSSVKFASPVAPVARSSPPAHRVSVLDLANIGNTEFKRGLTTSATRNISSAKQVNAQLELLTQNPSVWKDKQSQEADQEKKHVKAVTLSDEQNNVIELARLGYSIFYTGSAGTGKSLLLKSLIKSLKDQHTRGSVAVTASTGLAACNIGGMTLHSYTGIGLGTGTAQELLKKIKRQQKLRDRWRLLDVLIVDEISMIDGELFDKLDFIARKMKKNDVPFGGIQLIVCGDFYQLPPVTPNAEPIFAFESDSWKKAIQFTIVLKEVFRQQGDKDFVRMLNEVREGNVTQATIRKFKGLQRNLESNQGVIPALLFPTRREVETSNKAMLGHIPGPEVVFQSIDGGTLTDQEKRERLFSNFLVPNKIALKKGAQVMMVKNVDSTLVNGSLGKVLDFIDPDTYSFYQELKFSSDIPSDIDKRLSKMDELHKTSAHDRNLIRQTDTLSNQLDESVFSFMENIDQDQESIPDSVAQNIQRKKDLVTALYSSSKGRRLPLVRFILSDGSTRDVLVEPETFSVEDEFERPLVSRMQVPLILAWSLSIHKSQGQTLPLVKVDLKRVFEKGQAYVALSRATGRRGLQVMNFDPSKIRVHDKVVNFYRNLIDTQEAMDYHKQLAEQETLQKESAVGASVMALENLNAATANASSFLTQDNEVEGLLNNDGDHVREFMSIFQKSDD